MSRLLFLTSSLFGEHSKSRQIAAEFIESWRRAHAGAKVVERALTPESMPHLGAATLAALAAPAETRTEAQRAAVAFADELIEELEGADTVVIAAPMYNFSIPSTLKAWIDHVTRAGRTFRYAATGPQGLLTGKKVFIVTGRGGHYGADSPAKAMDFQEPYLRAMLGFIGLTDITFIHVEGLARGPEAAEAGVARARKAIGEIVPLAAAA